MGAGGGEAHGSGLCGEGSSGSVNVEPSGIGKLGGAANSLSGAGATFPAPIYSLWTSDFQKAQGVQVAYQSIGSGGGVQQISAQTVDFGASDAPMKDSELATAKGGEILHIPTVFGAVVPTYHLSGQKSGLKFTGEVLGKIFAGKIKNWNDPELTALNPDAKLPSTAIAVVHRSDGSGTTSIWTDYLTKASPTWVATLGEGKSAGKEVAWPTGIGGKGNEGVSGAVGQTDGALGYVELAYALSQKLPIGWVQNKSGKFIEPCIATVTAAAKGFNFPADLRFSLTDAPGEDAFPISGATWLLVYKDQKDAAKTKALVNFLTWIMDEGQKSAPTLQYAPLSSDLRNMAIGQIKRITLNGTPLVPAGSPAPAPTSAPPAPTAPAARAAAAAPAKAPAPAPVKAPAPAPVAAKAATPAPAPAAAPAPALAEAAQAGDAPLASTGTASSALTALAGAAFGLGGLALIVGARRRRVSSTA